MIDEAEVLAWWAAQVYHIGPTKLVDSTYQMAGHCAFLTCNQVFGKLIQVSAGSSCAEHALYVSVVNFLVEVNGEDCFSGVDKLINEVCPGDLLG